MYMDVYMYHYMLCTCTLIASYINHVLIMEIISYSQRYSIYEYVHTCMPHVHIYMGVVFW